MLANDFNEIALVCNNRNHDGEQIRGLCLRVECPHPCSICFKCIVELHGNCSNSIKFLQNIPQLLQPFQQIKSDLSTIQQKNYQETKQFICSIEQMLKLMFQYKDCPNLTNLNQLGVFLRESQRIEQTIKQLLQVCVEKIKLKDSSKQNIKSAKQFYEEGWELYKLDQYEKAIHYFQEAIKINPKYSEAWYYQGQALFMLTKYQEAINSYEILINLDHQLSEAWYWKGQALSWKPVSILEFQVTFVLIPQFLVMIFDIHNFFQHLNLFLQKYILLISFLSLINDKKNIHHFSNKSLQHV